MKSAAFTYHRPATPQGALELLAELGDDAKVLAGGQSLLPVMALRLGRPEHIVDIGALPGMDTIDVATDGTVSIGALVRHAQAEQSDVIAEYAPMVTQAMPLVGHRAIRNRGTVVGSIAHADAAAELPAVCLASGASMVAVSTGGVRRIPADDFFLGYFTTALEPNELLTSVELEPHPPNRRTAVVEVSRRHGDYAMVGLACFLDVSDGIVADAGLAYFGVASTPLRSRSAEQAIVGRPVDELTWTLAAEAVADTLDPVADVHATASYRRHVAAVLARRGLAQAAGADDHSLLRNGDRP